MDDVPIEQAIYGSQGTGGYRFLARSPAFLEDWLPEAQRLCVGFGERPGDVSCPACVFAQPFGKRHVAVVQVAEQGIDDAGRPGALGFRLLVIPRDDYRNFMGDPFAVADRFPPPWRVRGEMPSLGWPIESLPRRTVDDVQQVLKRVNKGPSREGIPQSPILLGSVQALVDGGRLVFERPAPDTEFVRGLWTLLPGSTRAGLWPASFAFGNDLGFHVVVVPRARAEDFPGYLTEEQAGDYPQGNYELNLQIAAEAGDQDDLDALFARRSRAQVWRLGLILVAVTTVLALGLQLLNPPAPPPVRKPQVKQPASKPGANLPRPDGLVLPPPEQYPSLTNPERDALTLALRHLAQELEIKEIWEPAMAETLLAAIDQRLGTPDPGRDPGDLRNLGPPQRQLQALLWKHGVAGFDDQRLNPVELVQRLERNVVGKDGKEAP